jgi:lysozyme family protein
MMIDRGNRSTRRKPAPVPLCPPQIPHAARTRTRDATVGSQRLTAWATARRIYKLTNVQNFFSHMKIRQARPPCLFSASCHYFQMSQKMISTEVT